ncbi:MAG: flagellar biosynthesis anti-sigma factor FlgM [Chromatiaceae bacterium]
MTMKIPTYTGGLPSTSQAQKVTKSSDQASGAAKSPTTDTSEGVRLSVTNMALTLEQITRGLSEQSAVDQNRVNDIRQAIENGEYRPSAERIADKLLVSERLIGG